MWFINDILGPTAAVGSWALAILALWKWGMAGIVERQQALVRRLAHGPRPKSLPPRPDYAEIARLEREVFGE